jgi:CO/xanthine dehydrogenase FAD-binding subunit
VIADADRLEVLRPRKLKEALSLLADAARAGDPLVPLAGGTDLFVGLNAGALPRRRFLDLWALDELRGIERDRRRLSLGALTTYSECIESRAVQKLLPILVDAAREVGGAQVQNRGTLGGNLGNGSPAADAVPVLAAADATVVLVSSEGEREVSLAAYFTGYRQSVRRPDELIARLELEVDRAPQYFRKVGTRAAQAISKIVLAAVGHRVALGSVAPTVVRAPALEAYVEGGGRDAHEARRLLRQAISPIDDLRSTAEYRLRVAENLIIEWLRGFDALA